MGIVQPTGYIQQTSPPSYLGFTTGSSIYLNANNRTSYPLSGSVWFDLSGNGRNGAITGSLTFVNGGTGSVSYWEFPGGTGSNANISVSSPIGASNGSGSVTIGGWCRTNINNYMTGSGGYGYVPLYAYSVGATTTGLSSVITNIPPIEQSYIAAKFANPSVAYPETSGGYFYNYNNKWVHIMMQWYYQATQGPNFATNNVSIYVNGTYQNTLRGDNGESGTISTNRLCKVGGTSNFGDDSNLWKNGSFATLEAYDRVLTSNEIYGNFYVSKSFYGY